MHSKSLNVLGLTVVFVALVQGCSSGSTVDLQKPAGAPAPVSPDQKVDPSQSKNAPSKDPSAPNQPIPVPTPVSDRPRYRMICGTNEGFSTVLTTARGVGGFFSLFLGNFSDPNKDVTRDNFNLKNLRQPMMVPGAAVDHMTLYFVGQKESAPGNLSDSRFYSADVDVLLRTGKAVDLGSVPSINGEAAKLAGVIGLAGVNYGASDAGTYTLLPGSNGLKVVSRDRTKTFGTLSVDSSRTLFPKIFEKEKLFSALVFDGNSFHQILQQLNITSTSVAVAKSIALGSGRSASQLQRFDGSSLGWAEAGSGSGSITIVRFDTKTFKLTRASYQTKESGAVVFPQTAFYTEEGKTTIYVAVEKVASASDRAGGGAGKVAYAKLQLLSLNAAGDALNDEGTIDYPQSAIDRVTANGRRGRYIIQTLLTSPNADEVMATFDDHYGFEVYKDRGGFMDAVVEDECVHPSLVQENF